MLRLRPYRTEDAKEILSWCKDEQAFYKWTAGVLGNYPLVVDQFDSVKNLMAFTAIDDNGLAGFFTLRNPGESLDEVRIGFVIVDPKKRGRGYGKEMLKLAIRYAKDIYGAKKVSLGVFENNPDAYYCYKSVGFVEKEMKTPEKYRVLDEEWNCLEFEMML